MFASLNLEQSILFKKYKFNNYVKTINLTQTQLNEWRVNKIIAPKPLSRDEILRIEKATRGQSKNELWTLLRLDRNTASASSSNASCNILQRPALLFGNAQESQVKSDNTIVFDHMRSKIESYMPQTVRVVETILDCGMFFSELGLHAASPDAYFSLSDGVWIPVEIKCPYNYRDTTIEQMRAGLGANRHRYRVKHTALSVNRIGKPIFEVVKTDAHYRQMQRQMYTMKSPMCFYIVKFKHNLVVKTVWRDDEFFQKETETEANSFVAFAIENANGARFQRIDKRVYSFKTHKNNHNFTEEEIGAITHRGIYLDYGYLKCAYCSGFNMDSRESFSNVMKFNHVDCSSVGFKKEKFDNPTFFDHTKRYSSLLKNDQYKNKAKSIAYFGYYMADNGEIKTFCCGVKSAFPSKHNHQNDCAYYLEILK